MSLRIMAAFVAVAAGSAAWAAQDVKVDGNWKWSVERNGQTVETKLTLKLDGDKLTGSITGRDGKDSPIEEASFKDGEVKFQITRDRNGQKFVIKYSGKVSGDTITGKTEAGETARDWKAERVK